MGIQNGLVAYNSNKREGEEISVEDYIAENLDDQSVSLILGAANILGNNGFELVAEKLEVGVRKYNSSKK